MPTEIPLASGTDLRHKGLLVDKEPPRGEESITSYDIPVNVPKLTQMESSSLVFPPFCALPLADPDRLGLCIFQPKVGTSYNAFIRRGFSFPYPGPKPYGTWVPHSTPRLQTSFTTTVPTSTGLANRQAFLVYQWLYLAPNLVDIENVFYTQFFTHRSNGLPPVMAGVDPKLHELSGQGLWAAQPINSDAPYCGRLPSSASASEKTFSSPRWFGLDFSWGHFKNLLKYLNQRFNLNLVADRNRYQLDKISFACETQYKHDAVLAATFYNNWTTWVRY